MVTQRELLPLSEYDLFIVSYSGGKDSQACLLHLLDLGIPRERIRLWHQCVDGEPGVDARFMDWPVTEAYVRATGQAFGIRTQLLWKMGGFKGEMLRENARTRPSRFERTDGTIGEAGGKRGKEATRRLFPQVSADLSVRYCSPYLKIDVGAIALNNDPALRTGTFCFVTGERREESSDRSKYAEVEPHRCDNNRRRVDQWRAVIDWSEKQVWEAIERHRVRAHPSYFVGFGRTSCLPCIFGGSDQWASVRELAPNQFAEVAGYEAEFGKTIKKGLTVIQLADKGKSYEMSAEARAAALATEYPSERIFVPEGEAWVLPPGAYKRCGGPT